MAKGVIMALHFRIHERQVRILLVLRLIAIPGNWKISLFFGKSGLELTKMG